MNRQQKQDLIDQLHKNFTESQASFLVNYQSLTVAQILQLRRGLRQNGGELKIAKMRLVKRALSGADCAQVLEPYCKGQLGVVFATQEAPAIAKTLYNFSKKNESLQLVAGCLESKFLSADNLIRIASLPSKEVLLAQLAGTMKAPLSRLAFILHELEQRLSSGSKEAGNKE